MDIQSYLKIMTNPTWSGATLNKDAEMQANKQAVQAATRDLL